jgi:hypothetical protein
MSIIYVMDTSALIQMKDDLPADVFPKLWDFLSKLVAEGPRSYRQSLPNHSKAAEGVAAQMLDS